MAYGKREYRTEVPMVIQTKKSAKLRQVFSLMYDA